MFKKGKKGGLFEKFQAAVDTAKSAAGSIDISTAREKLIEAGSSAKETIKNVKIPDIDASKLIDTFKKDKKHKIVHVEGSEIKILIPDGYESLKPKKYHFLSDKKELVYHKNNGNSENSVIIFSTSEDRAMNPDDLISLINEIHNNLEETQGLIEAKNGITKRGYKYIYSIVKTLSSELFGGVTYYLRMNLFREEEIIEIIADFKEIGVTGQRDTYCFELARRAGLAEISDDGFKGWSEDPFDKEFTKGNLKNLSEKEGMDIGFPEHPLSQAHEFILASLKDELIIEKTDSNNESKTENNENESEDNLSKESKALKEKERLLTYFVDENKRETYQVEVERNFVSESVKRQSVDLIDTEGIENVSAQTGIAAKDAIRIIYYLMAADGNILKSEEEKFDSIGMELDKDFKDYREQLLSECKSKLNDFDNADSYYSKLEKNIAEVLDGVEKESENMISLKLLLWDLLTISYSDENYDTAEKKLIKYIVDKANINEGVFMEMESSFMTIIDIDKEINWIKTTNKQYMTIEAMVKELEKRKNVIFESVKDLISL